MAGLTSVFGMGTGGTLPLLPPGNLWPAAGTDGQSELPGVRQREHGNPPRDGVDRPRLYLAKRLAAFRYSGKTPCGVSLFWQNAFVAFRRFKERRAEPVSPKRQRRDGGTTEYPANGSSSRDTLSVRREYMVKPHG